MKIIVKCYSCGHEWLEEDNRKTHCPNCNEWHVFPKVEEKMTL
jgi:predicted RNA-binding Zn-ribbon protein involved in translation (DUF1610 family)